MANKQNTKTENGSQSAVVVDRCCICHIPAGCILKLNEKLLCKSCLDKIIYEMCELST